MGFFPDQQSFYSLVTVSGQLSTAQKFFHQSGAQINKCSPNLNQSSSGVHFFLYIRNIENAAGTNNRKLTICFLRDIVNKLCRSYLKRVTAKTTRANLLQFIDRRYKAFA